MDRAIRERRAYPSLLRTAIVGLAVLLTLIAAGLCIDAAIGDGNAVPGRILAMLAFSALPAVPFVLAWESAQGGFRTLSTLFTLLASLVSFAGACSSLLAALGACAVDACDPRYSAAAGVFARAALLYLACAVLGLLSAAAGRQT